MTKDEKERILIKKKKLKLDEFLNLGTNVMSLKVEGPKMQY